MAKYNRMSTPETVHTHSHASAPHLYYQTSTYRPFVDSADGIFIYDEHGKEYIDACSSAVLCNIGHGNKRVLKAMNEQAKKVSFSYRTQFENEPAHALAAKLADLAAPHLSQVFYVSGGSEAVESAMKLSLQYYYARGETRNLFISRTPSFHGATMGALSLTSYAPLENPFRSYVPMQPKIPAPYCYRCAYGHTPDKCGLQCAWALEKAIFDYGPQNIAGFVAEPVGGASVGALPPPDGYFDIIQELCRKYGIMLILDEVMTGCGRTGSIYSAAHWGVEADIVVLSKGLGSGYFPLGATIASADIVENVLSTGGFHHGHTYAGNPMARAVGNEVLSIILEDKLCENVMELESHLGDGLRALAKKHKIIGDVRGKGFLWAIEMVSDRKTRQPFPSELNASGVLANEAYDGGLIIYPRRCINGYWGDHVLIAPPLITTASQIDDILTLLDDSLERVTRRLVAAY